MNAVLSQLPGWAALGAGTGGGFFIVKWFFDALFGRLNTRETALDKATEALIGGLNERVVSLTQRIDFVERGWRKCEKQHSETEAAFLRLQAVVEGRGEIRQMAARTVALDRAEREADEHRSEGK
jgi:hypothetical protein